MDLPVEVTDALADALQVDRTEHNPVELMQAACEMIIGDRKRRLAILATMGSPNLADDAAMQRLAKDIQGAAIMPSGEGGEPGLVGTAKLVDGGVMIQGQFKRDPWANAKLVRFELPPLTLPELQIRGGSDQAMTYTASVHGLSVCVTRETGMSEADVRHRIEYKLFEMFPARLTFLEGELQAMRDRLAQLAGDATDNPDPQWCSTIASDDEHVYGPYATREQALEGAWEHREEDGGDDETATLGLCEFADVGQWLDMDDLVERLEEIAIDNEWSFVESELFTSSEDGSEAIALREIRESLRRNYHSTFFIMADDGRETAYLAARSDDED